jgi:hypothetical protein
MSKRQGYTGPLTGHEDDQRTGDANSHRADVHIPQASTPLKHTESRSPGHTALHTSYSAPPC